MFATRKRHALLPDVRAALGDNEFDLAAGGGADIIIPSPAPLGPRG